MKTLASILALAFTVTAIAADSTLHQLTAGYGQTTNLAVANGFLMKVRSITSTRSAKPELLATLEVQNMNGRKMVVEPTVGSETLGPLTLSLYGGEFWGGSQEPATVVLVELTPMPPLAPLRVQRSDDLTNWTDAATVPVPATDGFWRLSVPAK